MQNNSKYLGLAFTKEEASAMGFEFIIKNVHKANTTTKYNTTKFIHEDKLHPECIISKYIGYEKDLVIPQFIDGVPVVSLGKRSLSNLTLNSLTLPLGLNSIGDEFLYNTNLEKVSIPITVTNLHGRAFLGWMGKIDFEASLAIIGIWDYPTKLKLGTKELFELLKSLGCIIKINGRECIRINCHEHKPEWLYVDINDIDRAYYGQQAGVYRVDKFGTPVPYYIPSNVRIRARVNLLAFIKEVLKNKLVEVRERECLV